MFTILITRITLRISQNYLLLEKSSFRVEHLLMSALKPAVSISWNISLSVPSIDDCRSEILKLLPYVQVSSLNHRICFEKTA